MMPPEFSLAALIFSFTAASFVALGSFAAAYIAHRQGRRGTAFALPCALCGVGAVLFSLVRRIAAGTEPPSSLLAVIASGWCVPALGLLVLFIACTAAVLRDCWRYSQQSLSPMSLKESFDNLPQGVLYCYANGLVTLVNRSMARICFSLSGKPPANGNALWELVERLSVSGEGEVPIVAAGDRMLSFSRCERMWGETPIVEIIAIDATEEYRLNEQIMQEIAQLEAANERLRAWGESVLELAAEREILAAKMAVHDGMSRALGATLRFLEERDGAHDRAGIAALWDRELALLETGTHGNRASLDVSDLEEAAEEVGIALEVQGELPRSLEAQRVLTVGAVESLLNASRHAHAARLLISIARANGCVRIRYTNDGVQPAEPVLEGGGMRFVRENAERMGGTMALEYAPEFALVLELPDRPACEMGEKRIWTGPEQPE